MFDKKGKIKADPIKPDMELKKHKLEIGFKAPNLNPFKRS